MSFRWRLALTYTLLLGLLLGTAGTLLFVSLRATLYAGLDDTLRGVTRQWAEQRSRTTFRIPPAQEAILDEINRAQPIRLTTYTPQGRAVDGGPSRVGFVARPGFSSVGGERVFVLRTATGFVQASQSERPVRASLWRTLSTWLLAAPALLLLALAVGYLLADRALGPVDQVSDLAARIAQSGQPGERVPPSAGNDELARLTRTINDMLARLDEQLGRERLFAQASAHELRTPISVIRAAASLSLEQPRTPEQYRAALTQVREVSEDMSALTTRLLGLARAGQAPQRRPVDLADVLLLATELHAEAARARSVRLEVHLGETAEVRASGEFDALVLAAGNLIQNAVRAAPPGSAVRVACAALPAASVLSVEDRGPGIPEADLARLVLPFQRGASATAGGAGLGLALVRAVAEAHGGELRLLGRTGGGLRAELALPRPPEAT